MKKLSVEDVKAIHQLLVADFEKSKDPISPPGMRGQGELLEYRPRLVQTYSRLPYRSISDEALPQISWLRVFLRRLRNAV